MNTKQREEAARRVAASVCEAVGRIRSDPSVGHQIVRGMGDLGADLEGPASPPTH